jgi:uncharacterized OB-fold protein
MQPVSIYRWFAGSTGNKGGFEMSQSETELLRKDFESSFTFTRSTGPVVGRFLTELRNRKIVGIKGSEGKVLVPPPEYDPVTFEPLSEFVEVGQSGIVKTWCWVAEPRDKHPLKRPFAWAMVLLDGADTSMLHVVDAGAESAMSTGMRVKVRWAEETTGYITDIACFEPA